MLRVFKAAALALAITAIPAAAALAAPNPPTVLDRYIARKDPSFAWKVEQTFKGEGYHGVVLNLTSQTWLDASQTDRSVWKHWVIVTIPDKITSNKAFLFIGGGSNDRAPPKGPSAQMAQMALDTSTVVVELGQVPNQPMRFPDTPDKARTEDDIISYLQARYDPAKNPEALVRLPMVKSATATMTAVQQYMAGAPEKKKIDGFVVAGGSKRGWTTWLTGLEDKRVVGMIPIVINVLDVDQTTKHHWKSLGFFSIALNDYVRSGQIPGGIGKSPMKEVNEIEDPLVYKDRPRMKIPKYVINAVGDEYFPPDNTQFSYHLLPANKRLRMLPNSKHSTAGTDINQSMTTWYEAIIRGKPVPDYRWSVRADGAIVVQPLGGAKPSEVLLWSGNNPKARDFRVDSIGAKAFTSVPLTAQPDGTYVGNIDKPAAGFSAYFVELTYPGVGKYPFKFTTEVYVKPNVYPFRWEDAKPIMFPQPDQAGVAAAAAAAAK